MYTLIDYSAQVLAMILETSCQAIVLAGLVVVLTLVLRERLSARWRAALWLLVIARLLMPIAPESSLSLFNWLPTEIAWSTSVEPVAETLPVMEETAPVTDDPMETAFNAMRPETFSTMGAPMAMESTGEPKNITAEVESVAVASENIEATKAGPSWTINQIIWLAVIALWALGTIVLTLRMLLLSLRLHLLLKRCHAICEPKIQAVFEAAKRELGVRRPVALLAAPMAVGPAVTGIFRPKLILGHSLLKSLSTDELRLVFLHELSHVRRQDLLVERLWQLAKALHWFNPIVWLAARRWQTDRELACDEAVLARLDRSHRASYGHAILHVMESLSTLQPVPGAVGVLMRRGFLSNRIKFISGYRPVARRWTALAVGLILLLIPIGLTNAVGRSDQTPEAENVVAAASENNEDKTNTDDTEKTVTISGRCVDEAGKPIAGAYVMAFGSRAAQPDKITKAEDSVMGETTTDADGHYHLKLTDPPSELEVKMDLQKERFIKILARADGTVMASRSLDDLSQLSKKNTQNVDLTLKKGHPIHGRLIDEQGKPVAGLRMQCNSIVCVHPSVKGANAGPKTYVIHCHFKNIPKAWNPPIITDQEGRFEVLGVPCSIQQDQGYYSATLAVEGNDQFAPQILAIHPDPRETGGSESESNLLFHYQSLQLLQIVSPAPIQLRHVKTGNEVTFTLASTKVFEGIVRYADTKQAAPHAKIVVWARGPESTSKSVLSPKMKVIGKADAQGRYRIMPYPGTQFTIEAYPPESGKDAYKATTIDKIEWYGNTQTTKQVDVVLPCKTSKKTLTISGRCIDKAGKPVAGAYAVLINWPDNLNKPHEKVLAETTTDEDGRYQINLPNLRKDWYRSPHLIVRAEGYGIAWKQFHFSADSIDLPFTLAKEEPIRCRLVDQDGKPAVGVHIECPFVRDRTKNNGYSNGISCPKNEKPVKAWMQPMTTDKDGRFVLRNVTSGHGAWLKIKETDQFAPQDLRINFNDTEEPSRENSKHYLNIYPNIKPGEEKTIVLAPACFLEGVVRDKDTGKPIPHAQLKVSPKDGNNYLFQTFETEADAEGRYRVALNLGVDPEHHKTKPVSGAPIRIYRQLKKSNLRLEVYPSKGTSYLARKFDNVPYEKGSTSKQLDVALTHGVLVRGKVTESKSKEPIAGAIVQYIPETKNNPNATKDLLIDYKNTQRSDKNGEFEIAVPPGPGRVIANDAHGECVAQETSHREWYDGSPGGQRRYVHAIKRIDPEPNAKPIEMALSMERGEKIIGRVTNEKGEPVDRAQIFTRLRMNPNLCRWNPGWSARSRDGQFELSGLKEGQEYPVHFLDEENRLGATVMIKAGDKPSIVLKKCGQATATFVDQNGKPISGQACSLSMIITPSVDLCDSEGRKQAKLLADEGYMENIDPTNYRPAPKTDAQGRVTFPALIPGATYRDDYTAKEFTVESGQTVDLGTIVINRSPKSKAMPSFVKSPSAKKTAKQTLTISGQCVDEAGKPVAGANVAAVGLNIEPTKGGERSIPSKVLAETTTDRKGNYLLRLSDVSSKSYSYTNVIARAKGTGLAWKRFDPDFEKMKPITLKLMPETPIRGRLLDEEGKPVAGEQLRLNYVMVTSTDKPYSDGVTCKMKQDWPAAWPPSVTSDEEGRFVVHGVGPGCGVSLVVNASDRFATQDFAINYGQTEKRGKYDLTHCSQIKNVKPGEEVVLRLARAKIFEGVVRYEDSGEPVPHTRVNIWASQQKDLRTGDAVTGQTDAEGRYRIIPKPGIRFGVQVHPPEGVPYLARRNHHITWEDDTKVKQVDITLPRGILVRGKVIDTKSKKPVDKALIRYIISGNNKANKNNDIIANGQARFSDEEGRFSIAVLPSPGFLFAHSPDDSFIFKKIDTNQLYNGQPGGRRYYAHAIKSIDLKPNLETVEIDLTMERGEKIVGRVVNEKGEPVEEASIFHSACITPDSRSWQGGDFPSKVQHGTFSINGLDKEQSYPAYFLDAKNRLGASAVLKVGEVPTVVLKPCGQANVKVIDQNERPRADYWIPVHMVVTPGACPFDFHAMQNGELAVDADIIENFDQLNQSPDLKTDQQGRITYKALIPGATYCIYGKDGKRWVTKKEFTVKSGQTLDLGKIVYPIEEEERSSSKTVSPPQKKEKAKPTETKLDDLAKTTTISGRCIDEEGKPIAGAHVAAIGWTAPINSRNDVLSEVITDRDGRYRIDLENTLSKAYASTFLLARAEGMGQAWERFNPNADAIDIPFEMVKERLIRGRLLDHEGQPVAGLKMKCNYVTVPSSKKSPNTNSIGGPTSQKPIQAWLAPITTDEEGRFVVRSVAPGHSVGINIEGTTQVASQRLIISTSEVTNHPQNDQDRSPYIYLKIKPGDEGVVTVAPAQIFEGVVRCEDTGKPVPYAQLKIIASRQPHGGGTWHKGTADAKGRYQIIPKPGPWFRLEAYPPNGVPYIAQSIEELSWKDDLKKKQVDIKLPRGVLIRGKVVEVESKKPIAGATIKYTPAKNPHQTRQMLFNDQTIQSSDENGQFEIAVLPGPGNLLAHGPRGEFVLQETSFRQLYSGSAGGKRCYANAIEQIDPKPDAEPIDMTLSMKRGGKVIGRIVDEKGKPVDKTLIISRLSINPYHDEWSGFYAQKALGGQFELSGLAKNQSYTVHFLDEKNRLGATALLKAGEKPTIVLRPCGSANATFVDQHGQPIVDSRRSPNMVITPGVCPHDSRAQRHGELAADTDLVPNIDRTNYWPGTKTDKEGHITFPALIPGATYCIYGMDGKQWVTQKEFTVESGQTVELGKIVYPTEEEDKIEDSEDKAEKEKLPIPAQTITSSLKMKVITVNDDGGKSFIGEMPGTVKLPACKYRYCILTDLRPDNVEAYKKELKRLGIRGVELQNGVTDTTLKQYRDTGLFTNLTLLKLTGSDKLTDLSFLRDIQHLTSLELHSHPNLTDLSALSELQGLTSLNLWHCTELSDISALSRLKNLTSLKLIDCDKVTDFSSLSKLEKLKLLTLTSCDNFTDISALSKLERLESLYLAGCKKLNHMDGSFLSSFKDLKSLKLDDSKFTNLSILSELKNLEKLHVSVPPNATNVSFLSDLKKLKLLRLYGPTEQVDLSALSKLENLMSLSLFNCQITDLSFLSDLEHLSMISFDYCSGPIDISILTDLEEINMVWFQSCLIDTSNISKLSGHKNLKQFVIHACPQITPKHVEQLREQLPDCKILCSDNISAIMDELKTKPNTKPPVDHILSPPEKKRRGEL